MEIWLENEIKREAKKSITGSIENQWEMEFEAKELNRKKR